MHTLLIARKSDFEKTLAHLAEELSGLRTGRAHPALVEHMNVVAYQTTMPLKSLATISVPDARTLQIEPWDQATIKDIERAISESSLGIHPTVDGKVLRLVMPVMTEEMRMRLVKVLKEKSEEARVAVRQVREDIRKELQKDEAMSDDEKFKIQDELDKLTKEYVETVEEMAKKKEEEVTTV